MMGTKEPHRQSAVPQAAAAEETEMKVALSQDAAFLPATPNRRGNPSAAGVPLRERQTGSRTVASWRRCWFWLSAFFSPGAAPTEQPKAKNPQDGNSDIESSGARHKKGLTEPERGAA